MSRTINQIDVKVDDVFYASWGYEQTNIDFVKVISVNKSGKSVKAVTIGQVKVEDISSMSETVAPDRNNVISKESVNLKIEHRDNGEVNLRGSYHYSVDGVSKHLATLYPYKHALFQSHYA